MIYLNWGHLNLLRYSTYRDIQHNFYPRICKTRDYLFFQWVPTGGSLVCLQALQHLER